MLDPSSLAGWFERHGDETPRMINMYGITETTVHVTWRRIVEGDLGSGSVVGGAIDGWQVHLLDRHGNLVPYGVAGEIHVGGDGVARGYLNRAELTAQRFLPDRFSTRADAPLYRSGDLARRLPDGDLEYLGRIDHQVKVRGFRIELGEIEHCLAAHPAISDVAVLPVDSEDGVELVAFLFGAPQVKTRELRQFLRRSVPPYMVPSRFVVVAERPLTSNGKLDRRLLLSLANEGGAA
jgi:acyl-coenzyme A synthetase/AMP-(fatty) acid ligase